MMGWSFQGPDLKPIKRVEVSCSYTDTELLLLLLNVDGPNIQV